MKRAVLYIALLFLTGCAVSGKKAFQKSFEREVQNGLFRNQFTGLMVYDPQSGDTLFTYNSHKYFIPASNTKIFTLYTALTLLPEQIPTLRYTLQNDSLFFESTADPVWLHPYFKDSTAIRFLENHQNVVWLPRSLADTPLGFGWAWEDYDSYYAPERNALPLYGNVVQVIPTVDSLQMVPEYFSSSIVQNKAFPYRRLQNLNLFNLPEAPKDTIEIPFVTGNSLTRKLLNAVLSKEISVARETNHKLDNVLYSIAADSLYKRMMHMSDNFLAEQLLLMASGMLSDTLNGETARVYMLKNALANLSQKPRWVDGSGLSRYNLFTPESVVFVLNELYKKYPQEKRFTWFPSGGVSGTLENLYSGGYQPYVYAKSGTLSNNYCLSGYLLTDSGKTLIFSFMNNHFQEPTGEVRRKIETFLEAIKKDF
ncbi:MAG: D-alanyl-D-alanine carboxypeptidase [Flavobacteriaceae bacterium]|nr:D-alanyl-D-alanine carboxypeptidase [Flavobacteriaceae bacterium]